MKYFTLDELRAKSEDEFHSGFLEKLDYLRDMVASPFHVTSCARTKAYNKKIGGSSRSLHISDKPVRDGAEGCMAVDIAVTSRVFKVNVIKTALALGWSVGVNDKKRFLHLDRRVDIGEEQTVFSY